MTSSTVPGGPHATTQPDDTDERAAWLALATVPGLGPRTMTTLLSRFGTASGVLRAPLAAFAEVNGITRSVARAVVRAAPDAGRALEDAAARVGQVVLTPADAAFPAVLRDIPDPPLMLYAVGDLTLTQHPAVAIVGSRDHTAYGAEVARWMGETAAAAGIVVVSGMARGLDAMAQAAALDAGGNTIGVLGNGADVAYPRANAALYKRVADRGLLLTESPPGQEPIQGAFPRRNRLISGLARALVVVEAADGSGTMITVATALEQGRDILAVPGPITSPTSRGTNRLIRDGATPLLTADDLLAAFGAVAEPRGLVPVEPPECTLTPTEARVIAALTTTATHIDAIALSVGLPIGELLGTLLGLELGGMAEQVAGGSYRRRARRHAGAR